MHKLVRRAANDIPQATDDDKVRLLAAMEGPVNTSEIPERESPRRRVQRDASGRLPERREGPIRRTSVAEATVAAERPKKTRVKAVPGTMRVYAYKVKAVVENAAVVSDQIHLAHRYHNRLIEIERRRRDDVMEILGGFDPEIPRLIAVYDELEAAIGELRDGIKRRNQAERRQGGATCTEGLTLAELKASKKAVYADLKGRKAAAFADPDVRAGLVPAEEAAHVASIEARASCNVFWGTYLMVERAMRDARKGAPPVFCRWDGDGAIGVQIQGGMDWAAALLGRDSRLRVKLESVEDRPTHSRSGKFLPRADPDSRRSRETVRALVSMRVGTMEDRRSPVWATVRVYLHRMPPPGSRIKYVRLHRRLVGRAECWELQFELARESWERELAGSGEVAVELGWKSTDEGIRVATATGSDGVIRTLVIPHEDVGRWTKSDSIRSHRDRCFDEARDRLAAWLKARESAPGWLTERAKNLSQWRSINRLGALVWHWREHRFPGDRAIYAAMEEWRSHDHHHHDYEDMNREKAVRRRNERYRRFVAVLRETYRTARLKDVDYAELKQRPNPESPENAKFKASKFNAFVASPGKVKAFLAESMAEVVMVGREG